MAGKGLENEVVEFEYEIPFTKVENKILLKKGMKNKELVIEAGKDVRVNWERFNTIKYAEDNSGIISQTYTGYIHKGEIVAIRQIDEYYIEIDEPIGKAHNYKLKKAGIQNG